MNEIVSFTKEINFNTNIDKMVSISLEHTISYDDNSSIKGDLIISGTYKPDKVSLIDTPFSYKIPIDIELDSKYDLSNMTIDIDNFTYDVDNNILKINVDLILDNLEVKKKEEDEIVDMNDLFLEEENKEKLEIPVDVEQKEIKEFSPSNTSLFTSLDSSNETYITYSIYIMKDNDLLEDVMNKYKVNRVQLEEYNDLNNIKQGTKIIIPNSNE